MTNDENRATGSITRYFENRGFGFLSSADIEEKGPTDVFFHISEISDHDAVEEGWQMEFKPRFNDDEDGWEALDANIIATGSGEIDGKSDSVLSPGDVIRLEAKQLYPRSEFDGYCPIDHWQNVAGIRIDSNQLPETPPEELYMRIAGIDGRTAKGKKYSFKVSSRLKPGEEIRVVVENPAGFSFTRHSGRVTGVRKLEIPDASPGDEVLAKIDKVSNSDALAHVEEIIEDGPEVGDVLESTVEHGCDEANPLDKNCTIGLTDKSLITGEARVEIIRVSEGVVGKIVSYAEGVPNPGEECVASVEWGEPPHTAEELDGKFKIELDEYVLRSGEVTTEITDKGIPFQGKIQSYETPLPEIGDVTRARVERGEPPLAAVQMEDEYEIILSDPALMSGEVDVEITHIDDKIRGTILSYPDLPSLGSVIQAEVIRGSQTVKPTDDRDYRIKLESKPLAWGNVDVKITDIGRKSITGEIQTYHEELPIEGQITKGFVKNQSSRSIATPYSGKYTIQLIDDPDYTGPANIEIVEISDSIKGEIVERLQTERPQSARAHLSPSKKKEISRKKL